MSSLDCDIPFGEFLDGKKLLGTFLCAVMKKPSKPGHISTPPSTISAYSLDCVILQILFLVKIQNEHMVNIVSSYFPIDGHSRHGAN